MSEIVLVVERCHFDEGKAPKLIRTITDYRAKNE